MAFSREIGDVGGSIASDRRSRSSSPLRDSRLSISGTLSNACSFCPGLAIANRYAGRGVVAVTELVVVASSMTAFAGRPRDDTTSPINPASVMARSTYGSITAWSSLAHGDPRMVGKWQLDCFNDRRR